MKPTVQANASWLFRMPRQLAIFLLAICLVVSQVNPCDATSVALGSSISFIVMAIGIWILVGVDSLLSASSVRTSPFFHWICWTFALFGAWLWFCTFTVLGRGNARMAYYGCWQWIAQGMLLLAIAKLGMRARIASPLCSLMIACTAGTVAYACHQYFLSMPAFRERFAADPNSILEKMGLAAGSSGAMQFANRLNSLEPTGPFSLTNSLAGLMAAWMVFLVLLLSGQAAATLTSLKPKHVTSPHWNWGPAILCVGLTGSFFVTLLLTKSRSGWLSAVLCLMVGSLLHPSLRQGGWAIAKRLRIVFIAISILCSVSIGTVLVRDPSILAEAGKSLSFRLDYWRGAWTMIQSRPWTGYGVANFQQNYTRVKVITASESPADPHNFVLETAAAGGWPLLIVLSLILTLLLFKTLDCSRSKNREVDNPFEWNATEMAEGKWSIVVGGLCACVGVFMSALLFNDDDTFYASILFVVVSILVFVWVERTKWIVHNERTTLVYLVSAAVVLVHLLASGGWMQPGVMNSVCVFVGLAFGLTSSQLANSMPLQGKSWAYPLIGFAIGSLAMADFARTTYLPRLRVSEFSRLDSRNPFSGRDPSQWLDLVKFDPLDPELPRLAAYQCVEELRRSDLSASVRQRYEDLLDELCADYLKRDPNHWIPNMEAGRWHAVLADRYSKSDQTKDLALSAKQIAFKYFCKAAEFYPNSAQARLQAAVGAAWCGEAAEAQFQVEKAVEIDRETLHADRKLSGVVVFFPKELDTSNSPVEKDAWVDASDGDAKGEPILRWLRSNVP
ncbi:MAG: O-antigen ligase family protein [Planctomycetota bacterium]|nr:O-antigen ligase family protein [Planctomycetota bacterium]